MLLNRRGYSLIRALSRLRRNHPVPQLRHRAHLPQARHRKLMCHYCGYLAPVPRTCPQCHSEHIHFSGWARKSWKNFCTRRFRKARIGRLDRDTVRGRDDLENMLSALHNREIDLLVGTQMIAKGHDIHGVTLVGVVGADAALGMPDFRAAERTFQLLTQVAGRAGRGGRRRQGRDAELPPRSLRD